MNQPQNPGPPCPLPRRTAADRARLALRDGRGRHPRRPDPRVEERAADAARTAARRPRAWRREFLVYEDDRATFETFTRAALAVAAELTKQGVKKGDRVAIIMRNLPEWPAIFYGADLSAPSSRR